MIPRNAVKVGQAFQPDTPGRQAGKPDLGRGFTLIELLVVILIILIISAVALPTILPALAHREVSEAARIVQGALVGARDQAIHTGQPSGIRLMPDPTFSGINTTTGLIDPTQILACNRMLPLDPAQEYSEGMVTIPSSGMAVTIPYPAQNGGGNYPLFSLFGSPQFLMIMESFYSVSGQVYTPNAPTSWFWNIRVGDRLQINNAGPWYTVVGPMVITPQGTTISQTEYANPEMFVNVGPPGPQTILPQLGPNGTKYYPEFLFLVNSQDDNGNGWVDEGWDGVDNNGNGIIDDVLEGESEQWQGVLGQNNGTTIYGFNVPYTIQRRPAPSVNAREVALPTGVVIDLTGWGAYTVSTTQTNPAPLERSRVPTLNTYTGYVDIMINPDGTVLPTTVYSSPSLFNMSAAFTHLWLSERSDLAAPSLTQTSHPFLPVPKGLAPSLFGGGAEIKGEYALVTLFNRTGEIATNSTMTFDNPLSPINATYGYNPNLPYLEAQNGVASGP